MKTLSVISKNIVTGVSLYLMAALLPILSSVSVFAQSGSIVSPTGTNTALDPFQQTLNSVLAFVSTSTVIIVGLAFLFFFYGLAKYILKGESDEKAKTDSKKTMVWSVIAIFVLTTIWGLIAFVRNITGVNQGSSNEVTVPKVKFDQ